MGSTMKLVPPPDSFVFGKGWLHARFTDITRSQPGFFFNLIWLDIPWIVVWCKLSLIRMCRIGSSVSSVLSKKKQREYTGWYYTYGENNKGHNKNRYGKNKKIEIEIQNDLYLIRPGNIVS